MSKRLELLGAEVARIQNAELVDGRRRSAVRNRLLRAEVESARPVLPFARPALGFVFACVALALVFLAWPSEPEAIGYRAGERSVSSQVDEWIAASNLQPLPIVFSDGSTVQLSPGSRARVRQLSAVGASVELGHGEVRVQVPHRSETRWSLEAGPFVVQVIGTRFRVQWEPRTETFALEVFEGTVRLKGPRGTRRVSPTDGEVRADRLPPVQEEPEPSGIIEPSPAPLRPPSHAIRAPRPAVGRSSDHPAEPSQRASSKPGPVAPRPTSVPLELNLPSKNPEAAADKTAAAEAPVLPVADPLPNPGEEPTPPSEPAWKELAEDSEYEKVLSSLSPEEFEEAVWQGDASDLVHLGAAARRTRDGRAGYIYSAIRSRFPGTDSAASAAFMLGRMQFHIGAPAAAAVWLETYLRERPDGRFAREATGRLIEAYLRADDASRARSAAERYLARYPGGPHAALARTVLK